MSPWILGLGPKNYPAKWKMPPKPWPHENEPYDQHDKAWAKLAMKAQQTRNKIRQLQKIGEKK